MLSASRLLCNLITVTPAIGMKILNSHMHLIIKSLLLLVLGLNLHLGFGQLQEGMASYYADQYHLQANTASGELYDRTKLTAAHRSHPFGTILRVTNVDNGKSVEVRVNDRGPFVQGRVVDLSYAAAEKIDMIQKGVVRVAVEVLVVPGTDQPEIANPNVDFNDLPLVDLLGRGEEEEAASGSGETATAEQTEAEKYTPALFRMVAFKTEAQGYGVQVGAYFSYYRLLEAMDQIAQMGYQNTIVQSSLKDGKPVFRILVGPYDHREDADKMRRRLAREKMEGIVVDLTALP